ncbi:helix-turn-helix domain-containing protein [Actinokineospora pegani]|uniref:helix-turn-helix domain-containing protein n=1 Tax=Actinokineospora pegani TaxID=2654637 RepID=UPI0018D2EB9E|nr:helix-turn-helix domain-containing protein [Actinokineospora pegani]
MVDTSESVIDAKGAEPLLLTPAQAAGLLQVRESWLRRQAGQRRVPCSFVGKHLRFSHADVEQIAKAGRRPARTAPALNSGLGRRSFE